MATFKRIFLFLVMNIAVMLTISIILSVLGVQPYLTANGIDYGNLMAFCLVWGFGGAFISLGMSRMMAKWMMGVKVIDPNTASGTQRDLLNRVYDLARKANIPMPEVGIYESPEINAFATGPTKSRSLVAVSTGLLNRMSQAEVDGVLAHEVAHIANGDMVTMTLLQGVVNAFVMFFARIAAFALGNMVDEEKRPLVHFIAVIVFQIAFSMLGMIVIAAFSRYREFRADYGSAQLGGKAKMIAALQALKRTYELPSEETAPAFASMKISNKGKFMGLFSTHPSLDDRIARLQEAPGI